VLKRTYITFPTTQGMPKILWETSEGSYRNSFVFPCNFVENRVYGSLPRDKLIQQITLTLDARQPVKYWAYVQQKTSKL
jgi:hypothetical protein